MLIQSIVHLLRNFTMFGRKDYKLTARIAPQEESGKYTIAEVALINTVGDEEYVTSAGAAFRKDEMTAEVRRAREKAHKDSQKSDD